jgi:protease II
MSSISYAPAAVIFWCWHAYLDDLYWDWQACAPYQQFSLQTGTALHETDETFAFTVVALDRDVFVIKKSNTGTNSTEIHVLSAASGYQQFSLQTGTALHETDGTFAFAVAPNRDVFAIKKSATGSNSTEIHVLSASRGYAGYSLQTGSTLHPTDQTFEFDVALDRDVFVIKKSNTGTNSTEVHALRH